MNQQNIQQHKHDVNINIMLTQENHAFQSVLS